MATKGIIIWRGDSGNPESHYSKSQIPDVTDDAALATLVTALDALTDCNDAKRSFISNTLLSDSEPGADANVDRKAIAYFRDPTTLKVHSITLAAPVSTATEMTDQGERLTAAAMSTIVAAINTATGKSYTALYGVVIQKR
jgi:hypothetical protein